VVLASLSIEAAHNGWSDATAITVSMSIQPYDMKPLIFNTYARFEVASFVIQHENGFLLTFPKVVLQHTQRITGYVTYT